MKPSRSRGAVKRGDIRRVVTAGVDVQRTGPVWLDDLDAREAARLRLKALQLAADFVHGHGASGTDEILSSAVEFSRFIGADPLGFKRDALTIAVESTLHLDTTARQVVAAARRMLAFVEGAPKKARAR